MHPSPFILQMERMNICEKSYRRDTNFKINYTASAPLSDGGGGQLSVPDFGKEVSETKWIPGVLKQLLSQMCLRGATIFFVRKDFVK